MIAMSWLLHQSQFVAPIVGGSKIKHVKEAVSSLKIHLSDSEIEYLCEQY